MTVIDLTEARNARRRRVMELALIRYGEMSVACVICNLTEEGAALDVGPQSDIPDQFSLLVVAKKKVILAISCGARTGALACHFAD